MPAWLPPWVHRAIQAVEIRKEDRVLLCTPGNPAAATAVAALLSASGRLTVMDPHARADLRLDDQDRLTHLPNTDVNPTTHLGRFDVVLLAPFAPPPRSACIWAAFVARHLRPGGRFCIDLPAPDPAPEVSAAARESKSAVADRLAARFAGPEVAELEQELLRSGLRRAERLLGTHLVSLSSPFDAAALLREQLELSDDETAELADAVTRRCRTSAEVELRFLRTAVAGMR